MCRTESKLKLGLPLWWHCSPVKLDFHSFLVIPFPSVLSPVPCQQMLVNPTREVIQLEKENPAKKSNCQHKPMWSWVVGLAWEQAAGGEKVGVV